MWYHKYIRGNLRYIKKESDLQKILKIQEKLSEIYVKISLITKCQIDE